MTFHDAWKKFRDEPTLLREIDEEELEHISDFLTDMKEDDLPFEHLFGSDMRVLIPFDKKLLPRRLQDFEKRMIYKPNQPGSWEVDFDTGMMRREIWSNPGMKEEDRPIWMPVPLDKSFEKADKGHRAKLEKEGWRFKTQQMKIGKFLTKYKRLKEKAEKAKWTPKPGTNEIDWDVAEKAEGELYDFAGSYFASGVGSAHAQEMLDTWGHSGGKSKPLAIVLSRHPIDILRMSDYEHIQSCHSPRSRGGGGEYYHCAVAEAHGHGAIAYLVNQEQLEEFYDKNLEPGKHDRELYALDDEELFADRNRGVDGIEPIARLRVRKFAYPKSEDEDKDGIPGWTGQIAVPEERIYGPEIPGFRDELRGWLKAKQEDKMKDLPRTGDGTVILLDDLALVGGIYTDTPLDSLFKRWLPDLDFDGRPRTYDRPEQEVRSRIGLNAVAEYQQVIDDLQNGYRPWFKVDGFRRILVAATAEDDGAGQAYIDVNASMQFLYPLDEFKQLPHNAYPAMEYLGTHFSDMGIDLFEDGRSYIRKEGENVVIEMEFDKENLMSADNGFSVTGYLIDPGEYEELLDMMKHQLLKSEYLAWHAEIKTYLRREGIMDGGAILNLAQDVGTDEFRTTGWEVATDDEYMPGHVNAKLEGLKVPPIPENRYREFKIRLREELIQAALDSGSEYMEYAKEGGPSYPNMWIGDVADKWSGSTAIKSGEFELEFEVTGDDPDDVVNTMLAVVLTVSPKAVQAMATRVAEEVLSDSEKDAWGRRRRNLDERLVSNWKAYLND